MRVSPVMIWRLLENAISWHYGSVYFLSAGMGRQVSSHLFTNLALSGRFSAPILRGIFAGRRYHVALAVFKTGRQTQHGGLYGNRREA
jgi:hypothetical protein